MPILRILYICIGNSATQLKFIFLLMYYYRICVYNSQSAKEKGKKAFERILSYEKIPPFPFEVILSSLKVLFGLKSVVTFEMSEDDSTDYPKYDFSRFGLDPVFYKKDCHDSKK